MATALFLIWLAGQIIRDGTWVTGLLFYLPTPFVFLALFGSALVLWRRSSRRVTMVVLVLAFVPGAFLLGVENSWIRPAVSLTNDTELRLVHWNVFNGRRGWENVESELQKMSADLYVLSDMPERIDQWAISDRIGSGYDSITEKGSMAVFARGSLRDGRWLVKSSALNVYVFTWHRRGEKLSIFAVDLAASILIERDPSLKQLVSLIKVHRPDIVVGDFNAPRRSRAICPLPSGFTHAYEAAGSGWSYTWPVPIPVYAIDHCILGERVVPIHYDLRSTLYSDHRQQVLDFSITKY
jgi:endonuclease/exonuclease/phosphatase (EEP) superfamily protein YafD